MKNNYYFLPLLFFLCAHFSSLAQQTDAKTLPAIISENTLLTKHTAYLLESTVIVSKDVVLTIEEGVTLYSNPEFNTTFLIESGAKVIACGSYDHPIKAISKNKEKTEISIIIRSVPSEKNDIIHTEDFTYKMIENPTVLMNANSSKTEVLANIAPDL